MNSQSMKIPFRFKSSGLIAKSAEDISREIHSSRLTTAGSAHTGTDDFDDFIAHVENRISWLNI